MSSLYSRFKASKLAGILPSLIAVALFVTAISVLHHVLSQYRLDEIRHAIHQIPRQRLLACMVLSSISYLMLSGYETLAFQYLDRHLPYPKILLTSFLSYAFANNTGSFSIIASSSVRYRLYGGWKFTGEEISKIIFFCMLSFWLGFLTLTGFAFLFEPLTIPASIPVPFFSSVRPLGAVFLLAVIGYLILCFSKKKGICIKGVVLTPPSPPLALAQIGVSAADLLAVGGALYILLPGNAALSFPLFIGLYLLALIIGLLSSVPGGLGVFESVLLLLLSPHVTGINVFSALVLFRVIYYFLPLCLSLVLLVFLELRRKISNGIIDDITRLVTPLIPQIIGLAVFSAGTVLLMSGATPAISSRLDSLIAMIPLPVLELSHFLGSIAGVFLLILANGLRRRLDAAYFLSILLLAAGILFSLLKGVDYEEAILLIIALTALVMSRGEFYRKTSLLSQPVSPGWMAAAIIVVCGSIWLGFFSHRHQEYSNDLWWSFALHGDAPRFLRSTVGVVAVLVFFSLSRLFRPAQSQPAPPSEDEINSAFAIVETSSDPSGSLVLLGDKSLLFSENRNAFLMYAVQGKCWVCMSHPFGPMAEWPELLWRFTDIASYHGGLPVFYEVGSHDEVTLFLDLGMKFLKIGEEGRVKLSDFSLAGSQRKGLRYIHNRLQKQGYVMEISPPEKFESILPVLRLISEEWLSQKKVSEKGFSLGYFNERYLQRLPIAFVRHGDEIVAFANLWPGSDRQELSIDLMRHRVASPRGVMDFLFIEIMLWGQKNGYQWFNLGMAPLAGLEQSKYSLFWGRVGSFVFRHGEHFYNFQGLRDYKDKFDPVWEPKYLVYPDGLSLPAIFTNLTALIGGGIKGVFLKR